MEKIEQWKQIKNYKKYEVSDLGHVRNKNTGRILSPGIQTCGYYLVCLSENGKVKTHSVHRLVMDAFMPIPNSDRLDINHKNYNKLDNRLENLEWCEHQQNVLHGYCPTELRVLTKLLYASTRRALEKFVEDLRETKGQKEEFAEKYAQNVIKYLEQAARKEYVLHEAFKDTVDEFQKEEVA